MGIKDTKIYKDVKEFYWKNLPWRSMNPNWEEQFYSVDFMGEKLLFHYEDKRTESQKQYRFRGDCLTFLKEEVPSYFVKKHLAKGDLVLDCGAHFGSFSVYASKAVGEKGKVVAFEPDPFNREILSQNLNLNNCNNVLLNDAGLHDHNGQDKIILDGPSSRIDERGNESIRLASLDSELEILDINPREVSFIKMDIEGSEIEAIEGAKRLLTDGKPFLAIASYHLRNGEKTFRHLEKRLPDFGYRVETGFPRHLITWAWKD